MEVQSERYDVWGDQDVGGEDFRELTDNPLLVSYGYWRRHFGANTGLVGQKLVVNGGVHTVAGVLPPEFHLFDENVDIWLPITVPKSGSRDHSFRSWLIAVGRLLPGATLQTAQSEMDLIAAQIAQNHPDSNKDWGVLVDPQ